MAGRKVHVVHLGNVGYDDELDAIESRRVLERFGGSEFIDLKVTGIDLKEFSGSRPDNWRQVMSDFNTGLAGLDDESVDVISSRAGLGEYDREGTQFWWRPYDTVEYTAETLNTAYRKLKPGGKILLFVTSDHLYPVETALENTQFQPENIKKRRLRPDECEATEWLSKRQHLTPYLVTIKK